METGTSRQEAASTCILFFDFFLLTSVTAQSRYLITEDADVGQVTVKLAKIQAVAHYEPVRDLEASEGRSEF